MGVEVLLHCLSKLPLVGKSKAWSKNGNLALWWGPKPELCLFASCFHLVLQFLVFWENLCIHLCLSKLVWNWNYFFSTGIFMRGREREREAGERLSCSCSMIFQQTEGQQCELHLGVSQQWRPFQGRLQVCFADTCHLQSRQKDWSWARWTACRRCLNFSLNSSQPFCSWRYKFWLSL